MHPSDEELLALCGSGPASTRCLEVEAHCNGCDECQARLTALLAGPLVRGDPAPEEVPVPSVPGYETLGVLGRGGMGVVYRVRDQVLNREVALKVVLAGAHASVEDRTRFEAEARALAQLLHPHIVRVFCAGEHAGHPFMALELCPGGSLAERLRASLPAPAEAAELVRLLAEAIHTAHRAGLLHRDLKPANVLFAQDGTPKITDFGLARRLDAAGPTGTGMVVGTPGYMPPEQARGDRDLTAAADVYALGAILYECLTGRPPFKAATVMDTLFQVIHNEPVAVRQLNSAVPRDLETIVHKCLQKEPTRRYASAQELADDLERFRNGVPVRARPVRWGERAVRWCRRNPAVAALGGLTLAVVLALALGALYFAWVVGDKNATLAAAEQRSRRNFQTTLTAIEELAAFGRERLRDLPEMDQRQVQTLEQVVGLGATLQPEVGDDRRRVGRLVARAYFDLGQAQARLGRLGEAARSYAVAERAYARLAEEGDPASRLGLGRVVHLSGSLAQARGDAQAAHTALDRSRDLLASLGDDPVFGTEARLELARCLSTRGAFLYYHPRRGEVPAATLREAARLLEGLPGPEAELELIRVLYRQGLVDNHEQLLGGEEPLDAALQRCGRLVGVDGYRERALVEEVRIRHERTVLYAKHASYLLFFPGTLEQARQELAEGEALAERLYREHPEVPAYARLRALCLGTRANLDQLAGRRAEAAIAYRRGLEVLQALIDRYPDNVLFALDRGRDVANLGRVRCRDGRLAEGYALYALAALDYGRVLAVVPGHSEAWLYLNNVRNWWAADARRWRGPWLGWLRAALTAAAGPARRAGRRRPSSPARAAAGGPSP